MEFTTNTLSAWCNYWFVYNNWPVYNWKKFWRGVGLLIGSVFLFILSIIGMIITAMMCVMPSFRKLLRNAHIKYHQDHT